jgi:hypothetical protein
MEDTNNKSNKNSDSIAEKLNNIEKELLSNKKRDVIEKTLNIFGRISF